MSGEAFTSEEALKSGGGTHVHVLTGPSDRTRSAPRVALFPARVVDAGEAADFALDAFAFGAFIFGVFAAPFAGACPFALPLLDAAASAARSSGVQPDSQLFG